MKKQGLFIDEIETTRLKQEAESMYDMIYNLKPYSLQEEVYGLGDKGIL